MTASDQFKPGDRVIMKGEYSHIFRGISKNIGDNHHPERDRGEIISVGSGNSIYCVVQFNGYELTSTMRFYTLELDKGFYREERLNKLLER